MAKIDYDTYVKIMDAQNTLCSYCENREICEKCMVTHLSDDAYNEALESGIIDDNGKGIE